MDMHIDMHMKYIFFEIQHQFRKNAMKLSMDSWALIQYKDVILPV